MSVTMQRALAARMVGAGTAGKGATLLSKITLTIAILISFIYALGFLFVLIGDPVDQFTDILDLVRSCALSAWVAWVVVIVGDRNDASSRQRERDRERVARERQTIALVDSIRRRESGTA